MGSLKRIPAPYSMLAKTFRRSIWKAPGEVRQWRKAMASFDANTLGELRDVREVAIRTEKHPQSAVVIWVVVADDAVFVRSVRASKGRWYRDLATGGSATLELAGR